MKKYKTTEKIPTWSLCYLVNGDATGLTDEEFALVDKWYQDNRVEIISPHRDNAGNSYPYFSCAPAFGLSAEVEDCDVIYNKR